MGAGRDFPEESDLFLVLSCGSIDVLCIWLGMHFAIFPL